MNWSRSLGQSAAAALAIARYCGSEIGIGTIGRPHCTNYATRVEIGAFVSTLPSPSAAGAFLFRCGICNTCRAQRSCRGLGIGFSLGFVALGLGERLERIGFITTKTSREHPLQKLGRSP